MKLPWTVLLIGALLASACSDDSEAPQDGSVTPDTTALDAGPTSDRGPALDGATDGGTTDLPPVDAAPDPCAACNSDEVCVQFFDGNCLTGAPGCVKVSASCLSEAPVGGAGCSSACEPEFCFAPYQCLNQVPCGTEAAGVDVYCYGP